MHWGWVSGYRFVAMEGNASPDLDDLFQIHALDDMYYFEQMHELSLSAEDDAITIDIDADYEKALEDIDMSSGLIVHGSFGEAIDLLENFRDLVFSPSSTNTGVEELQSPEVNVYPNPIRSGDLFMIQSDMILDEISLFDMSGRAVNQWSNVHDVQIDALNTGVYFLQCRAQGSAIKTIRLIIQ